MKRIKSIDILRGWCIFMMILGHMLSWWVRSEDYLITIIFHSFLGDIIGGGLLVVSGLSAVLFFRSRLMKSETSIDIRKEQVRNEYLFRALCILILALIFNIFTAIRTLNPIHIWEWFIPLTMAFSLILAYPLFKTSIFFRVILAIIVWIAHYYIVSILLPHQGQFNFLGIIYYILYNPIGLHPFLNYFSFFLIGTVIGEVIFEIYRKNDQKEIKIELSNNLLIIPLIIGIILIITGVLLFFPNFLRHGTPSSMIYSTGALLIFLSILLFLEESNAIKVKKSYRFFYFYSYYSLTIFFSHYLIFFVLDQLNAITIWIAVVGTFVVLTFLLRFLYKKYERNVALKVQIGRISLALAKKVEEKRNNKIELILESSH